MERIDRRNLQKYGELAVGDLKSVDSLEQEACEVYSP